MKQFLIQLRNCLFGINRLEHFFQEREQVFFQRVRELEHFFQEREQVFFQRVRGLEEALGFISSAQADNAEKLGGIQNALSAISSTQGENIEKLDELRRSYFPERHYESFDVRFLARLEAGLSSAKFFNQFLYDKRLFDSDLDLLRFCAEFVLPSDLVLEFGVFSGRTINALADSLPNNPVYGFDSFEGLPETWRSDFVKGAFAGCQLPEVRSNVALVKGWFDETLPEFLFENSGEVGFLHIDCDLYCSTRTVLNLLSGRVREGAVIVFDEFFNYPGWEAHEFKAFNEFIATFGFEFEYLAANPRHQQVAVRVSGGGSRC